MQTEENNSTLRKLNSQQLVKNLLECQNYKVNLQNGFNRNVFNILRMPTHVDIQLIPMYQFWEQYGVIKISS